MAKMGDNTSRKSAKPGKGAALDAGDATVQPASTPVGTPGTSASTPIGMSAGPAPRKVINRLTTLAMAARSAMGRYPQDVVASIRGQRGLARLSKDVVGISGLAAPSLAESWAAAIAQEPEAVGHDGKVSGVSGASLVCWLGHCTVLMRIGGMTVLTDPVLSHRIGVRVGPLVVGPHRQGGPAIDPETLPPIDLVLVSHAHFDHLDKPTLRKLARPSVQVITAKGTGGLIPRGFGDVIELPWGQSTEVRGVKLRAMKPAHWGARTAWDRHRQFSSYVLDAAGDRVLFAGDSGHTDAFDSLGPIKLGIFGIGAYRPWIDAHADPEQVMAMARAAGVRWLLPVHHSTFRLSDEPMGEPMERLLAAGRQSAVSGGARGTPAPEMREGPALVRPGIGQVVALGQ